MQRELSSIACACVPCIHVLHTYKQHTEMAVAASGMQRWNCRSIGGHEIADAEPAAAHTRSEDGPIKRNGHVHAVHALGLSDLPRATALN